MFRLELSSNPGLEKYRNWMNSWIYRIKKEMINGKVVVSVKIGDNIYEYHDCGFNWNFTQKPNLGDVKLEKFWMCLVEGTSTSSYKHYSEHSAKIEAERLSRLLDKKVFVLEATDYVEVQKPVVWQKAQEIPF